MPARTSISRFLARSSKGRKKRWLERTQRWKEANNAHRCEIKCPDQEPETCTLKGTSKEGCRKTTEIGMSFTKRGKCPGCDETELLHSYEGTYDDPNDMMCEACIEEFHDRCHEAEDAAADTIDTDAWADEEWAYEELVGEEGDY